jgi:hypothetical protein
MTHVPGKVGTRFAPNGSSSPRCAPQPCMAERCGGREATGVDSQGNRAGRTRQPDSLSVLERINSGIGHTRGYSIGIGGKRPDVWSPHTVRNAGMGLGVPCRDIAASCHGLSCEYSCRDQRSRYEGHFGHCFLHMTEAEEARLLIVECGQPCEIFHHALSTKRELDHAQDNFERREQRNRVDALFYCHAA